MFELFVIGTFWFWVLLVLELLILFAFIANENGFGATFSLIVFGVLLQFCGNANIIQFVSQNPLTIMSGVAAYFLIGTFWAVFKWWLYVRDQVEEYEDAKSEWLRNRGITNTRVIPAALKADFKKEADRYSTLGRLSEVPVVKDNKARIMRWMGFWWVSMVWSLINDFVTRIFRSIYYRISETLQSIADRLYAKVRADFD